MGKRIGSIAAGVFFFCGLANATAATVCVLNKETGRLEPLVKTAENDRKCGSSASGSVGSAPVADTLSEKEELVNVQTLPVAPAGAPQQAGRADVRAKRDWTLRTDHHTLEEAIEDFAAKVDYEVIYEAREFPLELRRDLTIAKNADFWEALRVLGEAYRKSDGAFQILPTKFNQIVVLPMGQATTDRSKQ